MDRLKTVEGKPFNGTLSPRCKTCHTHIVWQKVDFTRGDGYRDWRTNDVRWRLDVFCGCGMISDPEICKAARADYDQQNANAIAAEQEANLKRSCPKRA